MTERPGAAPRAWCGLALIAVLVAALTLPASSAGDAAPAPATYGGDAARTGWYSSQPRLSPGIVAGGTFGKLFSTPVDGQVYAQPLVANGVLVAATETNHVYGLDPETGKILWSRDLGQPWDPVEVSCGDLTPSIGITGTPVIDRATGTVYLFSKTYVDGAGAYLMHALDLKTGAERPNFPVTIAGPAANQPTVSFNPKMELQRPGLLLLDGVVYAGFGGMCDRQPFVGWIVGVSTSGAITTRFVTRTPGGVGGSVWQSGGGLVSDGAGQILFTTGNDGTAPPGIPGADAPADLGQAVVRTAVQPDGSLRATDFFSPYDALKLDTWDADLGSASPVALPPQFGTPSHPHLLVQSGKQGYVYLLDRDHLGGSAQGAGGGDAALLRIGPFGGVWAKPGVWPGDGGWIYYPTGSSSQTNVTGTGHLRAYHAGVDAHGNPTLSLSGTSWDGWGFSSSAGVVTSDSLSSGTALLWAIWAPNGTGAGAQLRAYDPVPVAGRMVLRFSAPIGTSSKFALPGVGDGRVYVGARDGHVLGFGAPVDNPLSLPPLTFPATTIGQSTQLTATVTALKSVTVTGLSSSDPAFALGTPSKSLPAQLVPGDELDVPVSFAPTTAGLAGGGLAVATSGGTVTLELSGTGRTLEPHLDAAPPAVSFGPLALGREATGTVTFANEGASPLTIEGVDLPEAPFSVADPPEPGDVIAGGDAITLAVTFAPTETGADADELALETTGGDEAVGLSGVGAPPPHLTFSSLALDFGSVPLGRSTTRGFTLTNTGGSTLTITKSKPPSRGRFVALTELAESTTLGPGDSLREIVRFTPASLTATNDGWTITGDDGSGVQVVTFTGRGAPPKPQPPPVVRPQPTPPPSQPRASLPAGLRRLRELPHRPIPGG